MKETEFISLNKEKWETFENSYDATRKNPELLSELYLEITEDLGYAQTFYQNRTIRAYLNGLAQKVFIDVHKQGEGEKKKKLIDTLTISLPLEIYRARKSMLFALISFLVYAILGAVSTYIYPDFPRTILGDSYIDNTLVNIEEGHPLAIYDSDSPLMMFYYIATNNLQIALLLFVAGLFATLGTHAVLFVNGLMLGAFQMFFYQQGLLSTSFLGIWIHGAFEISAIIIAAGAGITLGNGWLFPKSYTRIQSLRMSVVRGLKIMLSLVPFVIFAAFLESFVTHNYQLLPDWSKLLVILFSFALILSYYVLFPAIVAKKHPNLLFEVNLNDFSSEYVVKFDKIRSVLLTIRDSFFSYSLVIQKTCAYILFILFPISLILLSIQDHFHEDKMHTLHFFDWYVHAQIIFGFGRVTISDFYIAICWSLIIAIIFLLVFWVVKIIESISNISFWAYFKRRFLYIYLSFLPIYALFFFTPLWLKPIFLFISPFLLLTIAYLGLSDDKVNMFGRSIKFGIRSYRYSLWVLLFFSFFLALAIQPIASVLSIHDSNSVLPVLLNDLLDVSADFVYQIFLTFSPENALYYANVFRQCVYLLFFFFSLPLFVLLISFSYFSKNEEYYSTSLYKRLNNFGLQNNFRK